MTFVDRFIAYNTEAESPTSFWRWAGYACVGAVLRDNIYFEHGIKRTYPNIYVVLLADSAEHRKSVPLEQVSNLLHEIKNTKIIQGRTSIQAVITDLANSEMNPRTGEMIKGGSCILCAGELSAFFVDDPQSIRILTDLYDFKKEYVMSLKGSGKSTVKNVCLSMLAASNETLLKEVYTNKAVYGGLLGRTFFIKPDEFRPGNSLLKVDMSRYDIKPLVSILRDISGMRGVVTITDDAVKLYDTWYLSLRKSYQNKKDRTGVLGRIHTGVLKISMIIAAAEFRSTEITKECVDKSIDECSKLLVNYEEYASSMGNSNVAQIGSILLAELWKSPNKTISRKELLLKYWVDFTAKDLDELISTLEQAGMIKTILDGNECTYKMTDKCQKVFSEQVK